MHHALRPAAACLAVGAALLAACGSDGEAPAPAPAPSGLAGSVAVGVPLADARLRIVDADGRVVAEDVPVQADGRYTVPELSGRAPFRIEACGYAGDQYRCLVSAAQGPGTAHVTPLTDATVLLAGSLSADALAGAQAQLRSTLAPVTEGHVDAGFDFMSGDLQAGSRIGYDRVLDALGVATGVDGAPFVQITPRTGSGNLFLQSGSATGRLAVDSSAATLPLTGLDDLFAGMSAAMADAGTCARDLPAQMAAGARLAFDAEVLEGAAPVAEVLCGFFAEQGLFGATLMSPTLGRCDTSGAAPRCRVGFVLRLPDGGLMAVGQDMGAQREEGGWKFLGSFDSVPIMVAANAQRSRRVDGSTPVDTYVRALAVEVPALPGLACARVSQPTADGGSAVVALLKPWGEGAPRLSVWRDEGQERSLNPASGQLRGPDDTWLMLPEGEAGDTVARHFFRGGRTVTVALYADEGCSSAFSTGGRSRFEVDVQGAVPVWAAMSSLPWAELTGASVAALRAFAPAAGQAATLDVQWTYPGARGSFGELTFCSDMSACGEGEPGRLGQVQFSPALTSRTLTLTGPEAGFGSARMLALFGRGPDGTGLQANFTSCPGAPAGEPCR